MLSSTSVILVILLKFDTLRSSFSNKNSTALSTCENEFGVLSSDRFQSAAEAHSTCKHCWQTAQSHQRPPAWAPSHSHMDCPDIFNSWWKKLIPFRSRTCSGTSRSAAPQIHHRRQWQTETNIYLFLLYIYIICLSSTHSLTDGGAALSWSNPPGTLTAGSVSCSRTHWHMKSNRWSHDWWRTAAVHDGGPCVALLSHRLAVLNGTVENADFTFSVLHSSLLTAKLLLLWQINIQIL